MEWKEERGVLFLFFVMVDYEKQPCPQVTLFGQLNNIFLWNWNTANQKCSSIIFIYASFLSSFGHDIT